MALGTFAGSAWIGVKPNFSGFNKAAEKGATSGGRAGGKAMGKAFGDEAEAATKAATRKLSSAVGSARNAEATAAGKVRVAEQRLAEARSTGKAKTSQLAAAEENLAKAHRDLSTAQGRTRSATDTLSAAKKRNAAASVDATKKQSRFAAGTSKVRGKLSSLTGSLKNATKQYGALAGAAAITAGGALAGASVKAASAAQQSIGATETVFKKASGQIIKYSDQAAMKQGLSANQYRESANLIGSLFKNQGVSTDQLAGKTNKMIGQASDLAATFGGTTSDAVGALSSAFKGEFDPLEAYGISLKQSTVNSEAMRLANVKSKKEWDALSLAQQKSATQQATTSLIMKQSKDSTGAFAKEADTLAGQQQRLGAAWEDGKVTLGKGLLPVLTTGLKKVTGFVQGMREGTGAGGRFRDMLVQAKDAISSAVTFVVRYKDQLALLAVGVGAVVVAQKAYKAATMLATLWTQRQAIAQTLLNRAMMLNPVGLIVGALVALGVGLVVLYKKHEGFRNVVNRVWAQVKKVALGVVSWFRNTAWPAMSMVFSKIGAAGKWLWQKALGPAFRAIGRVISWWYTTVVKRYFGLVGTILRGAGRLGMWLWKNALAPAFRGIGAVASWLWSSGIKPGFVKIGAAFRGAASVAKWLYNKGIRPAFDSIAGKAGWLWGKAKAAFDKLKAGIRAVKSAFSSAKSGIGKIWDGLSGTIAKPINAALDWIEKHFLKKVRSVLRAIGAEGLADSIPVLGASSTVKGYTEQRVRQRSGDAKYATGGRVHGYSPSPTADNIPAWLTAGEYVLPVNATRSLASQVGPSGLEQLRRGVLPGYAMGGKVQGLNADFLKKLQEWNAAVGNRYYVNSGYRSIEHQTRLWNASDKTGRMVARPGGSNHNFGVAADLGPTTTAAHRALAARYGLRFPMSYEPWHVEPVGARGMRNGERSSGGGVFSGLAGKIMEQGAKALNALLTKAPGGFWAQAGASSMKHIVGAIVSRVKDAGASSGGSIGGFASRAGGSNVDLGRRMAAAAGWTGNEWLSLKELWTNESNWNHRASNPSSGAYGIPQSLPGSKMASSGADWRSNPSTQIDWGIKYIKSRPDYGRPSKALSLWRSRSPHWYAQGGPVTGYASGTPSATPGPHWVGEHGPELMWFRGGERVASAPRSRQLVKDRDLLSGPIVVKVSDRDGLIARFVDGRIDVAAMNDERLSRRGM